MGAGNERFNNYAVKCQMIFIRGKTKVMQVKKKQSYVIIQNERI